MFDLKAYKSKIDNKTTTELIKQHSQIVAKLSKIGCLNVFPSTGNSIYFRNAYKDKNFQLRLEKRRALAGYTSKINEIIKANGLDFSTAWYKIYGYFIASDETYFKASTEYKKINDAKLSLLDVLHRKSLEQVKKYFRDVINFSKELDLYTACANAHKNMEIRGFHEIDIKFMPALPQNWQTIYDNVLKTKVLDELFKERDVDQKEIDKADYYAFKEYDAKQSKKLKLEKENERYEQEWIEDEEDKRVKSGGSKEREISLLENPDGTTRFNF